MLGQVAGHQNKASSIITRWSVKTTQIIALGLGAIELTRSQLEVMEFFLL